MSDQTTQKATSTTKSATAEVEASVAEIKKQGYVGTTPDQTPNENYTVAGVVKGLPTPENNEGRKDGAK